MRWWNGTESTVTASNRLPLSHPVRTLLPLFPRFFRLQNVITLSVRLWVFFFLFLFRFVGSIFQFVSLCWKFRQQGGLRAVHSQVRSCGSWQPSYSLLSSSSPNSEVESVVPCGMNRAKSPVARPASKEFSIAAVIRAAASFQPRYSSIMIADRSKDDGLTTFFPAMLGAVPCVASKMACPVR